MTQTILQLTPDEHAKLHALGGPSWVRVQVQKAELSPPKGSRSLYALSLSDRRRLLADAEKLGPKAAAQAHCVKEHVVFYLRKKLNHA